MKKVLSLMLALAMVLSLTSCGGGDANSDASESPSDAAESPSDTAGNNSAAASADDIEDNMTSADGTYEIAFVTDVGDLKDKSFNQGTWDGVKLYANANSLSYKYYQPANSNEATDDDRYDAMKAAVENGAKVVVCAGFLQETALTKAAEEFPDANFIFIDNDHVVNGSDGNPLSNVVSVQFQEEQSGFLAGYAVVKEGFTKLGFSGGGGGSSPACCRYGYGYVQGANAAAAELGITVDVRFSWQYGSNYSASNDLQNMIGGWYNTGTEIVFACGGSMFSSIAAAAASYDGYVVGVDVDQSVESDTVVTSAMKGIGTAAQLTIGKSYDGQWDTIGGTVLTLGAKDESVGLPTDSWSMSSFTTDQYEELFDSIQSGSLTVDADYSKLEGNDWSNVNLEII